MPKNNKRSFDDHLKMIAFFKTIWTKRKDHRCEVCNKWLGEEPRTYMFDHVLEKSKYPELRYEEENIMYICLQCHDEKSRGFLSQKTKAKIEELKRKFINSK